MKKSQELLIKKSSNFDKNSSFGQGKFVFLQLLVGLRTDSEIYQNFRVRHQKWGLPEPKNRIRHFQNMDWDKYPLKSKFSKNNGTIAISVQRGSGFSIFMQK